MLSPRTLCSKKLAGDRMVAIWYMASWQLRAELAPRFCAAMPLRLPIESSLSSASAAAAWCCCSDRLLDSSWFLVVPRSKNRSCSLCCRASSIAAGQTRIPEAPCTAEMPFLI
jgi:hypothetical protein